MYATLIDELIKIIRDGIPELNKIRVEEVCIGLGYTGVLLETGHLGIAATLLGEMNIDCCEVLERAGELAGSSAEKLMMLARSWDLGESAVGVATLNALSQMILEKRRGEYVISFGDFIDELDIRKDDVVGMVGYFEPFIPKLRKICKKLYVFERGIRRPETLPDTAAEHILPDVDVAILTGSAIVNKSLEHLLELARNAREVGVVGPSASFIPDPLFERGATIVGGMEVIDPRGVMKVIKEGGGTRRFKPYVKFMNFRRRRT